MISRYPDRRIDVMFGPVFTIEAHLAFSGARIHSNNTAEMTAMIEALSFLGLQGLGTIEARTHVRRLRLTMQHVYRHRRDLGNECADHAAALGTFGLISNHYVATRLIHHNFDASVCFDGCDNISEVLERLQHIRKSATSFHQNKG